MHTLLRWVSMEALQQRSSITLMKTRICFMLSFVFRRNQPIIYIKIRWNDEPVPIDKEAFLSFLYKHEADLDDNDIKFSFLLSKIIKSAQRNGKPCAMIDQPADQRLLFKHIYDNQITAYWRKKNIESELIFSDQLPLTIHLNQQNSALCCEMKNWSQFANDPYFSVVIYDKPDITFFCNGTVVLDTSPHLVLFIIKFLTKQRQYLHNNDAFSLIEQVYKPHSHSVDWVVNVDVNSFKLDNMAPKAHLTLTMADTALTPILKYSYNGTIIDPQDDPQSADPRTKKSTVPRQLDIEKNHQDRLMALFIETEVPFLLDNPSAIRDFMDKIIPTLESENWIIESHIDDMTFDDTPLSLEFVLEQDKKNKWFQYKPSCKIMDEEFALHEIATMMVENQGYISTKNGYIKLSEKTQSDLQTLTDMGALTGNVQFSESEVTALISQTDTVGSDHSSDALIEKINTLQTMTDIPTGPGFHGKLRDYQQFGLNWIHYLYSNQLGGVLADDMGLGKTIQTLAFISQLNSKHPHLVIGPTNVIYNWSEEIKKFLPKHKVFIYAGADRQEYLKSIKRYDIIITSFGIVKNDIQALQPIQFECVLVDEAQYIKNPATKLSKAIKTIQGTFRLAMTGTPIENNIQDLWNLFDFTLPNYLGTLRQFENAFKTNKAKQIKIKVSPFILRREKQEVLDSLPEKTEIVLKCPLSEPQQQLYQTVLKTVKQGIRTQDGKSNYLNMLSALLKLRQVCIHPGLLSEFNQRNIESAKFDLGKEYIRDILAEGHKLVVFSQFAKMLDFIQDWLTIENLPFERIDGTVTGKKRNEAVQRFQNTQDPTVFLISLKAGGVGINLTAADYVIHFDPWWNPAAESQATDRVHRMGQKNKVIIYKLITEGTIEEKILELQEEKRNLLNQIVNADSATEKTIDMHEIEKVLLT